MEITGLKMRGDRREDRRRAPAPHRKPAAMKGDRRVESSSSGKQPMRRTSAATVRRAKVWTAEVEENFRLQTLGWRDLAEYEQRYGRPERWENGFIKCLRVKKTGYFTYWQAERECEDRFLSRVKLYRPV